MSAGCLPNSVPDPAVEEPQSRLPCWLRRRIERDLPHIAATDQPGGPQADRRSGFVPRILREAKAVTPPTTPSKAQPEATHFVLRILREDWAVAPPVTPSKASVSASVTPAVTVAPSAGSICPTCQCRVPARLTSAERQRAYRKRKREQGTGIAKVD
jgi:hypothetical protein